jgi:hypothetical protein
MARTPRLFGIVADHRTFLMAVQRLHRRVHVENPQLAEKRRRAIIEMATQPCRALIFMDRPEGAPYGVLAEDFLHAEQLWQNDIPTKGRDMGVTLVPGQDRQHRRTKHVAILWRVGAGVKQRAIRDESVEQTSGFQKVDKERKLSQWRQRRAGVPLNANRSRETIKVHARRRALVFNRRLFTCRVRQRRPERAHHASENA